MFNQLEEKYVTMIEQNKEEFYRLAYSHVKNEHDALDIMSEAVYKGLRSLHKLNDEKFMKTWFYRILINESLMALRKKKKIVYNTEIVEITESTEIDKDEIMDLYHAIDKLSTNYKSIVILKYLRQMKIQQISDILQLNPNTVKTRLRRGIQQLKQYMGGY
ncbi:sigma-70 family RNA polymerase sigma factor [Clostridiaceae bacterium M8S5]|nr:sigma-70 family RNA polymerase sigma factor [Clostridiaceae bacterium M8S5]